MDEALERLRVTRPAVRPNDGFMSQLKEMERNLESTIIHSSSMIRLYYES